MVMGGNPGKKQEAGRAWITVWALVEGMGAGVGCHAAKFSCPCAGFGGLCGGNTLSASLFFEQSILSVIR